MIRAKEARHSGDTSYETVMILDYWRLLTRPIDTAEAVDFVEEVAAQ